MFTRLRLLIRGFINRWIWELEGDNPDIVYDNAIEALKDSELELRGRAAAVIRQANDLEAKYKETEAALKRITELLDAAKLLPEDQVDMDAAADMVNTQEELARTLVGMKEDWDAAERDEAEVRDALTELQAERRKVQLERDREIGRYEAANSRIAIHERQDGVSKDEIIKSLDNVRGRIKNRVAEANLASDMKNNSLEAKVKKFEKKTEGLSAKQKFMAMRQQAQTKVAAPVKSM